MATTKVCIDPGHAGGNVDPGAVGINGTQEADVTLAVSKKVAELLENVGYTTILTRTESEDAESDDLGVRTDKSNLFCADLFVSIHCNAFDNPAANGIETWYYTGSESGSQAAQYMQDELNTTFPGMANRGVKNGGFYVLKYTDAVAILVEMGFITNENDHAVLTEQQDELAAAVARGITNYFASLQ